MASTVTSSLTDLFHRAPLRCSPTAVSNHGCEANKSVKLCEAIMSTWSEFSEDSFEPLVQSLTQRIKEVLKAKKTPTKCVK